MYFYYVRFFFVIFHFWCRYTWDCHREIRRGHYAQKIRSCARRIITKSGSNKWVELFDVIRGCCTRIVLIWDRWLYPRGIILCTCSSAVCALLYNKIRYAISSLSIIKRKKSLKILRGIADQVRVFRSWLRERSGKLTRIFCTCVSTCKSASKKSIDSLGDFWIMKNHGKYVKKCWNILFRGFRIAEQEFLAL